MTEYTYEKANKFYRSALDDIPNDRGFKSLTPKNIMKHKRKEFEELYKAQCAMKNRMKDNPILMNIMFSERNSLIAYFNYMKDFVAHHDRLYTYEKANELYKKMIEYSIGDKEIDIESMTPKKFLTTHRSLFMEMYNSTKEMKQKMKEDKQDYLLFLTTCEDLLKYLDYMYEFIKQEDTKSK
jgi:tetratricopeptide (TPR) repeat protein